MQQNQKMRADANLHTPQVMESQNTWLMCIYVHTNTRPNPEHIKRLAFILTKPRSSFRTQTCIKNILFISKDYCSPLNMCFYLSQTFKRAGPCCDIIVSCSSKPECLTFFQLIQKQKFFLPCSSLCIYKERTIKLSCFIKMVHMTCMNFSKYFKAIFFFFTFTHLADAFIQSDLQCIQVIHVLSVCVFPGNRTHNLCAANAMLYHWATGTLPQEHFHMIVLFEMHNQYCYLQTFQSQVSLASSWEYSDIWFINDYSF